MERKVNGRPKCRLSPDVIAGEAAFETIYMGTAYLNYDLHVVCADL